MRLCKVLPEDDEKQQRTNAQSMDSMAGIGSLKREALGKRLFDSHVILSVLSNISSSVGFSGAKMSFYRS